MIDGGRLIYTETDPVNGTKGILLYNLSTGTTLVLTPGQCDRDGSFPVISGDLAAWYESDTTNYTISLRVRNIHTNSTVSIPLQMTELPNSRPSIAGDRVVFENNYRIMVYNLTSGENLSIPKEDPDLLFNPSASGNLVVYGNRSGPYTSIWLYDLSSQSRRQLVPGGEFDMIKPMIGSNRIVWEDWRSGNPAIRMFTLGSNATCPMANFSANTTYGPTPLAVRFNDTSSGSPATWDWDFGDGNQSSDRNPVHTYEANGTFPVHLAVSAPDCRGFLTRESYITAGSPPVFDINCTPLSGLAPLAVHFTAISGSGPAEWSWDFGDGQNSTDQSPDHTYTMPGWYTVSLTGRNEFGNTTVNRSGYIAVSPGILNWISGNLRGSNSVKAEIPSC